jgi:superfamily I DNA/RNA helicase
VAIADYQSGGGRGRTPREREESKRLAYVALTRARDRL